MAKKAPAKAKKVAAKPAKKVAPKKAAVKAAPVPVRQVKIRKATKPKNDRSMSYTQSEFVENVRAFAGMLKRAEAKELCEDLSAFIVDSLRRGYKLPLLGLGKLYVRRTKPRVGRNPATGEMIQIPSKKRVRFTPAKVLKEAVL